MVRTQVQGQEVDPVVHDSLGKALEEYAPSTPEEVLFKEGEPESFGEMQLERPEPPVKRIKTRHCPACESGMEAPGIRHSKERVRRNQETAKRSIVDIGKSKA